MVGSRLERNLDRFGKNSQAVSFITTGGQTMW